MRFQTTVGPSALTALLLTLTACGGSTTADDDAPANGGTSGSDTSEFEALSRLDIVAPAAPGSGWDQTARAMAEALQAESLAETVTVTNVPGASGTVALAQVSSEQGQEEIWIASGLAMMTGVITNTTGVTLDDLTPIARVMAEYEMIVVPAESEFETLDDLLAAIEADPAGVPIAGGSAGSADQLFIGLLAEEIGVEPSDVNYVPFSGGGEATTALLGNQVAAGISGTGEFQAQVAAGELRGLVVSSLEPVSSVPDVPTLTDAGFDDLEFFNWRSVMAPNGLPDEVVEQYITAADAMHESQTWQDTLTTNAWSDVYLSGDEFGTWLDEENARVVGVLESLGLVQ